jgi:hypothetical protein
MRSPSPNMEVEKVPSFLPVPVEHVLFAEQRETFSTSVTPSPKKRQKNDNIEYTYYTPGCTKVSIRKRMPKQIKLEQKVRQSPTKNTLNLSHILMPEL